MKIGWKWIVASLLITTAALSACGKKGSSSNPVPTAGVDQFGNPIAPIGGGSGYIGQGRWRGTLTVRDVNAFREMLYANQICRGYSSCAYVSNWLYLSVALQSEWLPGPASFSLRTFSNGYWSGGRAMQADAYANGNNGFQLTYSMIPMPRPIPMNPYAPRLIQPQIAGVQNSTIQIVSTFADSTRTLINTSISFRGRVVASGILRGQLTGAYQPYAGQTPGY